MLSRNLSRQPQVKRQQKHDIITTLVSSFIGLAYEGISSFLQHKWNKALHKAVNAMNEKANIQHNKLIKNGWHNAYVWCL